MRSLLLSLTMLSALAPPSPAAAPPVAIRAEDQLDYLFLGSDRPVLLRLHVRIGGKAYRAPWDAFMDEMFAWFDKNGDGWLSAEEAARMPKPSSLSLILQGAFFADLQSAPLTAVDSNKDGKVSREEFRAYYHNNGFAAFSFRVQVDQAEQAKKINGEILKRLDRKGDGKLTAAKAAGLYEKLRALDENEDEILTRSELDTGGRVRGVVFVGADGRPDAMQPGVFENSFRPIQSGQEAELVKALVAKYDRNKDGKLDLEEIGLGETAFARLDADKDGSLSPAELRGYVAGPPDLVLRLQLSSEAPGGGLLWRFGIASILPAAPRVMLVNQKTIDPALKKAYRSGPGDACAMDWGDTRVSLRLPQAGRNNGVRVASLKSYYFQLFAQAAGKKDHVTRADLKDPNFQILLTIFPQADKNADEKLSRAEINTWLDFVATAGDTLTLTCNDLGRGFFEVLDADGDGRLSLREMQSAWKRLGPLAKEGALRPNDLPRTMRLDIGMGGQSFSAAPFAVVVGAAPRPAASRSGAPPWFRKMDRNNDGDISPREWLGTDEEFKAIDADGDGLISAAEAIRFDAKNTTKVKE